MTYKIGIILGSPRQSSNTSGISHYLTQCLSAHYPSIEIELINLTQSPGHPLPILLSDTIPASHPTDLSSLPNSYLDPLVKQWSQTVLGWDGLIIITPQYNWGYPSILKNSLDHLYHEWRDLPVGIVTFGGHGGGKCMEQLKIVLGGGLKMRLNENNVQVTLPKSYIVSGDRVKGDESWLEGYEGEMKGMIDELLIAVEMKKGGKLD